MVQLWHWPGWHQFYLFWSRIISSKFIYVKIFVTLAKNAVNWVLRLSVTSLQVSGGAGRGCWLQASLNVGPSCPPLPTGNNCWGFFLPFLVLNSNILYVGSFFPQMQKSLFSSFFVIFFLILRFSGLLVLLHFHFRMLQHLPPPLEGFAEQLMHIYAFMCIYVHICAYLCINLDIHINLHTYWGWPCAYIRRYKSSCIIRLIPQLHGHP